MTSETERPLEQKLTQWIASQGYPLEMLTAIAFQKQNFNVSLSDYYVDFETQETREVDVTALRWSSFDNSVALQVCFRIECKSSKDKPWVVFVPEIQRNFWFPPFDVLSSKANTAFWLEGLKNPDFTRILKSAPLLHVSRFGYGVTQAFTTGQDVPYKAIMSTVKACVDRVTHFDNMLPQHQGDVPRMCCVTIPIIVIEGKLFECELDSSQSPKLREVELTSVQWKGNNPHSISPIVHITTKSALDHIVALCHETANAIIALAQENMQSLHEIATILSIDV